MVDHDRYARAGAHSRVARSGSSEDSNGLAFELSVPDTSAGRDVLALAERGDLGGMSFGFLVIERWREVARQQAHAHGARSTRDQRRERVAGLPGHDRQRASAGAPARSRPPISGDLPMGLMRAACRLVRTRGAGAGISWDALRGGIELGSSGLVRRAGAENSRPCSPASVRFRSAMASLPAYVYRNIERGRETDAGHPLTRLIAFGPNPYQTWVDFVEWVMASALLRGNALAEIVTDARGAVTMLRPIPWDAASCLVTRERATRLRHTRLHHRRRGPPRRLLQDEVFHLRDRSDDGLLGRFVPSTRGGCRPGRESPSKSSPTRSTGNGAFPERRPRNQIKLAQDQRESAGGRSSARTSPVRAGPRRC